MTHKVAFQVQKSPPMRIKEHISLYDMRSSCDMCIVFCRVCMERMAIRDVGREQREPVINFKRLQDGN